MNDFKSILLSEEKIKELVGELAQKINEDYKNEELLVVGILRGSVIFLSDLVRKLNVPLEIDFMAVSSYGNGTKSSGNIRINYDLKDNIRDRNVLIVEDIIDTGNTLSRLKDILLAKEPKSLKIVTLLDKPDRREVEIDVDYIGTQIPDEFVVGYGLDYANKYRNLPFIAILKEEIYS